MLSEVLADCVLIIHFAFVLFVVTGAFLVLKWRWLAYFHIPCAAWGAMIEFTGWICPLTPLEIYLRQAGGSAGYRGGFLDHYLLPLIYPHDLTRGIQILLGFAVVLVNLIGYGLVVMHARRVRR